MGNNINDFDSGDGALHPIDLATDVTGILSETNLPASVTGAVLFIGTWDASANSPALASGTGNKGDYYVVSNAGSTNLDGITDWQPGDWAIFNGTIWEKVDNTEPPDVFRYLLRYTHSTGVPVQGTQFLRLGENLVTSSTGDLLTAAATLLGITVTVNVSDATRTFNVEVVSDPKAATPTVLATLALGTGIRKAKRRDLTVAIPVDTEIGVRLVRASGSGSSTFSDINVEVEVSIP